MPLHLLFQEVSLRALFTLECFGNCLRLTDKSSFSPVSHVSFQRLIHSFGQNISFSETLKVRRTCQQLNKDVLMWLIFSFKVHVMLFNGLSHSSFVSLPNSCYKESQKFPVFSLPSSCVRQVLTLALVSNNMKPSG